MRHKIVELDSVGNADREALCQYPSRPIVAHKVFSNFNNQMVFGSHQSQKGDEIISIHPNLKPLKAHRGGIFTIMSTVHEGMHETPEQNSSGKGGERFGKPEAERWIFYQTRSRWIFGAKPEDLTPHATINWHIFALIKLPKQTRKSIT